MLIETVRRLQPLRELPVLLQYGPAFLVVLAFFSARLLPAARDGSLDWLVMLLMFGPAVLLAALLMARGAAFFAVVVATGLGVLLIVRPSGPVLLPGDALLRLAAHALLGLAIAGVVASLRHMLDRLVESTTEQSQRLAVLEQENATLGQSDEQKELLLQDIHHRIKNHLHMVSGYLLLGQRDAGDPRAADLLGTAATRLRVLSRVYDRLQLRRDTSTVSARGFIEELVNDLQPPLIGMRPIVLQVEAEEAELSSGRAATLGLIINELVTNAVRFAFAEDEPGSVFIYFSRCEGGYCLEVVDDGRGFRSEERTGSLGQRVLRSLVQQLGGTITWAGPPGTRVSLVFPEEAGLSQARLGG